MPPCHSLGLTNSRGGCWELRAQLGQGVLGPSLLLLTPATRERPTLHGWAPRRLEGKVPGKQLRGADSCDGPRHTPSPKCALESCVCTSCPAEARPGSRRQGLGRTSLCRASRATQASGSQDSSARAGGCERVLWRHLKDSPHPGGQRGGGWAPVPGPLGARAGAQPHRPPRELDWAPGAGWSPSGWDAGSGERPAERPGHGPSRPRREGPSATRIPRRTPATAPERPP